MHNIEKTKDELWLKEKVLELRKLCFSFYRISNNYDFINLEKQFAGEKIADDLLTHAVNTF